MWSWLSSPLCPAAAQNGDLIGFMIGTLLVGIGIGGAIASYQRNKHLAK